MRNIYTIKDLGSYILEPEEVTEIERDFDKLVAVEVSEGLTEEYYKMCDAFDKKWDRWRIVPATNATEQNV